eukprot:487642_1
MASNTIWQRVKITSHLSINILTQHHHHTITNRCFSNKFTKGVDWSKRKKILRIAKYKQKQSYLEHTQSPNKKKQPIMDQNADQDAQEDDIFLDQVVNPNNASTTFVKRKYDQIHGTPQDDSKIIEYQFRPALFTTMIKGTRSPQKLLILWLRDREKCPIDHINTAAAIVHLAQLCLEKLQPHQIYEKTMSWSVIRLIRDVMDHIEHYEIRQIANIMWSIGVITSHNNDNIIQNPNTNTHKIHRDFRRVTAKLLTRFETDIEIRRKCNVQNMVDMLWTMNCVGLKVHKFFYQFCVDLYVKLDIDIGVTPDALSYLSVLYAVRVKMNEKMKTKAQTKDTHHDDAGEDKGYLLYNESIPKRFWMKLLKEFCDDFVLIEAEPHHIANILWSFGRIGNKYLNSDVVDSMEEQWMIESFNKLLSFVQNRLAQCDGQTLSILLWAVTCSNYRALMICKKHPIFDHDKEMSVSSRILQLIETDDCYIIPSTVNEDGNSYFDRYSNKAYSIRLSDCIVIFEAVTKMEHVVPPYILTLMLNRMKEQLKYSTLSVRELISLVESVDILGLNEDIFHGIMAKKLIQAIKDRAKAQWNYSEFIGLFKVMNRSAALYKNLDLVYCVLNALQLSKQGWGQMDHAPVQLLLEQFCVLEKNLVDNQLVMMVEHQDITDENVDDKEESDNDHMNLTMLLVDVKRRILRKTLV